MPSERGSKQSARSPQARLFVALDFTDAARAQLALWRDGVVAGRDDLRPVSPWALHLTLCFLGYRPQEQISEIAAAALAPVEALVAPELTGRGVVGVPPRRPRLFALDLEDHEGRASAMQRAVSDALETGRYYVPEKRPFWPHVTLARVKRGVKPRPLEASAPDHTLAADRVTFYQSILHPTGARYEALASARPSG